MVRSLLAVFQGALLMFVWGFVFWVFTPLPAPIMKSLPNESVVVEALKSQKLEAGSYHAPFPTEMTEEGWTAFSKRHEEGPLLVLHYQPGGQTPMGGATLGLGFAHMIVCCTGMAFLLWLVGGALPSFVARWSFVVLVGLLGVINLHGAGPIWFTTTWMHAGILSLFDVMGWVLAGIPLASLVPTRTL